MPLNVKCKNCNNYRNDWCEKVIDSPDPDVERDCWHFVEKTNADRIRAMSDEELAAFLCKKFGCHSDTCPGIELCKPNEGKANGLLKWLQHPAELPKEE